MVAYSVPTKTFVRGKIDAKEKFFILAQTEYFPSRYSQNSVVINYISTKRDGYVTFTSLYNEKSPLYFNYTIKKGGIYLSVDGNNITKYPIRFKPGRNVDLSSLYAGVWYSLYLEPTFESVPWDILGVYLQNISPDNQELIGGPFNGYMTRNESVFRNLPNGSTKYCFVPEKYFSLCGNEMNGFNSLKKWITLTENFDSVKGFTKNHEDREWFEYPTHSQPQYITGAIKRGGPVKGIPKKEITKRKRNFVSDNYDDDYFTTDDRNDNYFLMMGFIVGLLLAFLIGLIVYLFTALRYTSRSKINEHIK